MRIAVVGAGAVGSIVAWRLARAGAAPLLVGRGPHLAAIAAQGLHGSAADADEVRPVVVREVGAGLAGEPPCELLLLAVKAQDVGAALAGAGPLLGPDTTVVPLLNGLPWWLFHGQAGPHAGPIEAVDPGGRLWQALPPSRLLGAVVHLGAEVTAPGRVRQAGDNRLTIGLIEAPGDGPPGGAPDAPAAGRAQALAALLGAGGLPTTVHPAIRDEVWTKLVGNLATNPLSALTRATLDRLFAEPGLRAVVEAVMRETMALGASLGVRFALGVEQRIAVGQRLGAFRTSMLQDFERGRPLELGAIADAALELAERLGVPMPTTRLVRDLARAAERSRDLRRGAGVGAPTPPMAPAPAAPAPPPLEPRR
jgi:2-dehydropantoate 2-reductase